MRGESILSALLYAFNHILDHFLLYVWQRDGVVEVGQHVEHARNAQHITIQKICIHHCH